MGVVTFLFVNTTICVTSCASWLESVHVSKWMPHSYGRSS